MMRRCGVGDISIGKVLILCFKSFGDLNNTPIDNALASEAIILTLYMEPTRSVVSNVIVNTIEIENFMFARRLGFSHGPLLLHGSICSGYMVKT